MTKQLFTTALFLFAFYLVKAQNPQTVNGRILQKSDSLPVFGAHIYLENKGVGATSNENGYFSFHVNEAFKGVSITISSIGFASVQIPSNISKTPLVIYLEEDLLILESITVTAIEPIQILKNVISNIENNYPQEKFKKEIYYKEAFAVNNKPIRYLEIVANLVSEGFSNKKQNPYKHDLFIKQKRPGFNNDTTFEGGNGIGVLHWLNGPKRYLKKSNFKNYSIELVGYSMYRNHEVFKLLIKAKGEKKVITSMYITTETFALVAINQWYENNDRTTIPKNIFRYLKWNESVDFIQLGDGLWYINSINDYRLVLEIDGNIDEIKRLIRLTNVYDDIKIKEKNRITKDIDLYTYPVPYNEEFWNTYNAPPETDEEKRAKKELMFN